MNIPLLVGLVLSGVAAFLVWLLVTEVQRQQRPNRPSGKQLRRKLAHSRKSYIGKPERWHLEQASQPQPPSGANPVIKNRLDSLTKDRRVSDRLVHRLLLQHPGRSEQWAYEKAIYDLERDRV